MLRLFVGIELPDVVKDLLLDLEDPELPEVRWTTHDQFHLTLRFIGDVHEGVAAEISEVLATINADRFPLQLEGIDCFGTSKKARIIWARLRQSDRLSSLQRKIEQTLVGIGLEPEHRKYRPHVTIARCRNLPMQVVASYLEQRANFVSSQFQVKNFALFTSENRQHEMVYLAEDHYPLSD